MSCTDNFIVYLSFTSTREVNMGVQNELEGQNFLRVVTNEILLGCTVILGFSTCPPRHTSCQGDPFSSRTIVEPRLAAIL